MADRKGKPVFKDSGKRGGESTLRKHGTQHYARIAKLAHASRAANRKNSA